METPINGVGSRGFRTTGRGGTGVSLAADKGGGQTEMVLDDAERTEHDTDWKALLARHAWLILQAALYHASGSVSAGRPYGMVAIWF